MPIRLNSLILRRLFNSSPQVTLLSLHFKVNKWPEPIPIRIIQAEYLHSENGALF
jgi:hypothetical protein